MSFFARLKQSLSKTKETLVDKIEGLLTGRKAIDESFYEELEEILIQADVGVDTSLKLIRQVREQVRERKIKDPEKIEYLLQENILSIFGEDAPLSTGGPPTVIMVVGVNGTGKTTTIGKLAYRFKQSGQKVLLAASDTFRAAAIDQLEIWGKRVGADLIKHQEGADPAAVAYDALQAARSRKTNILIIDTAGRLHTKTNLMEELKKIKRVLARNLLDAPHEVLLVLDATTGQNALSQAKIFDEAVGVTGLVLTKLDGTAKGGAIIGIKDTLNLPVKFIGIGEKLDDLQPFKARDFIEALFQND